MLPLVGRLARCRVGLAAPGTRALGTITRLTPAQPMGMPPVMEGWRRQLPVSVPLAPVTPLIAPEGSPFEEVACPTFTERAWCEEPQDKEEVKCIGTKMQRYWKMKKHKFCKALKARANLTKIPQIIIRGKQEIKRPMIKWMRRRPRITIHKRQR
mmetsp:Transcript_39533/g.83614  ORF Transcript_39533/g.83614 Transcript_39533/m.83614 type:complete len:155 (-) Transcript_39533:43-507(-)